MVDSDTFVRYLSRGSFRRESLFESREGGIQALDWILGAGTNVYLENVYLEILKSSYKCVPQQFTIVFANLTWQIRTFWAFQVQLS